MSLIFEKDSVLVFDGTNLMHRNFYSHEDLKTSDGFPTGAIYGTIKALMSFAQKANPIQMYVCFDKSKNTFRKQLFTEYKENRKPTDDRLIQQFPLLKEFCNIAGIPYIEADGYEADDIIGSLCSHAKNYGFIAYAVSGDKDLFQLLEKGVKIIYVSNKGLLNFEAKDLAEKYDGLKPEQVIDFKALQGDASDNIPGVPGIGEKTAIKLLSSYGSLDGIYQNINDIQGKMKEKLESNKDKAYLSKNLATIKCDVPLEYNQHFEIDVLKKYSFNTPAVKELLKKLEFNSILEGLK